jgi:methylated-DNA-[protein]-cysteine S-methyltransferase
MDAANFRYDTPHGPIYGYLSNEGLRELRLPDPAHPIQPYLLHSRPNHILGRRLMRLFADYLAGVAVDFGEFPLDPAFGTTFQRAVWDAARDVPHGQTVTYGKLAARVGSPSAARAVGSALGENPFCIVVPCHRILATGGKLGGFSAGLDWKRRLLRLEGIEGWKE